MVDMVLPTPTPDNTVATVPPEALTMAVEPDGSVVFIAASVAFAPAAIMAVPAEPTGLTASAIAQTSLVLAWPAPADATSVTLEMSPAGANAWATLPSPVSPYSVTGLTAGTAYDFRLTSIDAAGPGTPEVLAGVSTLAIPPVPAQPIGFEVANASVTQTALALTWTPAADAASYEVAQAPTGQNAFAVLSEAAVSPFAVSGLTAGTAYDFRLIASNATGPSAPAMVTNQSTLAPPSPPTGLKITTPAMQTAVGTWDGVGPFTVQYKPYNTGNWIVLSTNGVSPFTFTGLTGVSYDFGIVGADAAKTLDWVSGVFMLKIAPPPPPPPPPPLGTVPPAPIGLAASALRATSVTLTWTAAPGAISYLLQQSPAGRNAWTNCPAIASPAVVTVLAPTTAYDFQVFAVNTYGQSISADVLAGVTTPAAPIIVPPPPGSLAVRIATNWGATPAPAGSVYSVFHAFAEGVVPAGSIAIVRIGTTAAAVQQCDNRVAWPDGSLRCGVFTWAHPNAIEPGATDNINFALVAGAWNNAGGPAIGGVTAHDFQLQFVSSMKGAGSGSFKGTTCTLSKVVSGSFDPGDKFSDAGKSGTLLDAFILGNTLYVEPINGTSQISVGSILAPAAPAFSGSVGISGTKATLGYVGSGYLTVGSPLNGTEVVSIDTVTGLGSAIYKVSVPQYLPQSSGLIDSTTGSTFTASCFDDHLLVAYSGTGAGKVPVGVGDVITGPALSMVGGISGNTLTATSGATIFPGTWLTAGVAIPTFVTQTHGAGVYTVNDAQIVPPGTSITANVIAPGQTIESIVMLGTAGTVSVNDPQTVPTTTMTSPGVAPGTTITAFGPGSTGLIQSPWSGINVLSTYTVSGPPQYVGVSPMSIAGVTGTVSIVKQISGAPGGAGDYEVSESLFIASEAINAMSASPVTYVLDANAEIERAGQPGVVQIRSGPACNAWKVWGDFRDNTGAIHGTAWGKLYIYLDATGNVRIENEFYCNKIANASALPIASMALFDGAAVLESNATPFSFRTLNKVAAYDSDGRAYSTGPDVSEVVWAFPLPVLADPITTGLYDSRMMWWYPWSDEMIAAFPVPMNAAYIPYDAAHYNNPLFSSGIDGEGAHDFEAHLSGGDIYALYGGSYQWLRFLRQRALGAWNQMMFWVADPISGHPPVILPTAYPGLRAPQVGLTMAGSSTPSFTLLGGNFPGSSPSTSHAGLWWYGLYLLTGSEQALENILEQSIGAYMANNPTLGYLPGINPKFNGVQHYGAFCSCEQSRGIGFQLRNQSNSEWVCPDAHPVKPYLGDLMKSFYAAAADMFAQFNPPPVPPATWGNWGPLSWWLDPAGPDPLPGNSPWMENYKLISIALDVMRGRIDNTHQIVKQINAHNFGCMIDGNFFNAAGAYRLSYMTGGTPSGPPWATAMNSAGGKVITSWTDCWGFQDPPHVTNPLISFGIYGAPILSGLRDQSGMGVGNSALPPNFNFAGPNNYVANALAAANCAKIAGWDALVGPSGPNYPSQVIAYLEPLVDGSAAATDAVWGSGGNIIERERVPA